MTHPTKPWRAGHHRHATARSQPGPTGDDFSSSLLALFVIYKMLLVPIDERQEG